MSDKDVLETILSYVIAGAVIMFFLVLIKSCNKQDAILLRDRNSKCFEQTQDKQCWGIK